MSENVDRRVLGGIQCVDAITNGSILDPLVVSSPQLTLRPNRVGIYVIWDGPGFHALTTFVPPSPWPAPTSFEISIEDPSFRYLPRRSNIQVPQPLPAPVTPPQTLNYGPQQVMMYRGPASSSIAELGRGAGVSDQQRHATGAAALGGPANPERHYRTRGRRVRPERGGLAGHCGTRLAGEFQPWWSGD